MAKHIMYEGGLKYTFPDDDTYNAYQNQEAFFDESQTFRRNNGQIYKGIKVEADDRSDSENNNDDYTNEEENASSSQNYDTLPFPFNILVKAIYIYRTNEEVQTIVNELVISIAPIAKEFFISKIIPFVKKEIGKIKYKATKMINELMEKPNLKSKKQTQTNAQSISVKTQNSKRSDKKIYMIEEEVAQERFKILLSLYTIYESSEKLKNAEIIDDKTLLEELNNPKVIKQFKQNMQNPEVIKQFYQYMQNPKALPLSAVDEINLIGLPETLKAERT